MALLEPVLPFLTLIDRLICLVRERKTRRRDYFEKIIDPLYTQFRPLGEDYLKLFRDAQDMVDPSSGRNKKADVMSVRKRREEFAAARAQLRALLQACDKGTAKRRNHELTEFIGAMSRFFDPLIPPLIPTMTLPGFTAGQELVGFFEMFCEFEEKMQPGNAEPAPRSSQLQELIQAECSRLEASW